MTNYDYFTNNLGFLGICIGKRRVIVLEQSLLFFGDTDKPTSCTCKCGKFRIGVIKIQNHVNWPQYFSCAQSSK